MTDPVFDSVMAGIRQLTRDSVFRFAAGFARFEYALKRSKVFARKGRRDAAEPNWVAFANAIESEFVKRELSAPLMAAIKYLTENPPRQQKLTSDMSMFFAEDTRSGEKTTVRRLVDLILRIRNNLFHGGKFPLEAAKGPERDVKLLDSASVILNEFLWCNASVREHFCE